ncbi:MAG TPA: Spy/CpxP family protein refolding chaperone [Ignavibacteriaceae bacterium]
MKSNIFVIIIITLIVTMIQSGFSQERMKCRNDGNQFQVFEKLNLTESQQDQIVTLKLNHQMEMIDLKANLQKKKLAIAELKNKGNYTREAFIDNVEAINSAKNEIAISRANIQMDIYQLLDDNQKKEWNKCSFNFGERKQKRMKQKSREGKN